MTPAPNPPAPTLDFPDAVVAGARAMYEAEIDPRVDLKWTECHVVFQGQKCRAFAAGLEAYQRAAMDQELADLGCAFVEEFSGGKYTVAQPRTPGGGA